MNLFRYFVLAFLILLPILTSCGEGGDEDKNSAYLVTGGQLGTNETPVSELRKNINFSIVSSNSDFTFGTAIAAKALATSEAFYWFLSVTNVSSSETYCFIRVENITFTSADDTVLETEDFSYVEGYTKKLSSSAIYTNTCLEPNQSGHVIGIEMSVPFNQVANIQINSISKSSSLVEMPAMDMSVLSYSAEQPPTTSQEVNINVVNNGPESGQIRSLSLAILLDDNDVPLIWSFFNPTDTWDGILAANERGVLTDTLWYEGFSNKILLYLDYDALPLSEPKRAILSKKSFISKEDYFRHMLKHRNNIEEIKSKSK